MKKVYILIGLIMLLFTTYEVINTYAKYVSTGYATASKQAGAWTIEVNSADVTSRNSTHSFQINSLTYPSSQYVLANKMAPSSSGYFDIIIDATDCSVAVRFDVTIDLAALSVNSAIHFQSASRVVNGVEDSLGMTRTGANTYTGIVNLADIKADRTVTARFYLAWDEDGTGTNDANDSLIGVDRTVSMNLSLPVTVVVSQYSGETITPYV